MALVAFCPSCGARRFSVSNEKHWKCTTCGFQYFHNMASAVGGIIVCGNEILLAKRKYNPGKGMLDLPGGFVDYRESLEDALARECEEELAVTGLNWQYLTSFPNQYLYADVLYHTQDAFFIAKVQAKPDITAMDDVEDVVWKNLSTLKLDEMAFESAKNALRFYLAVQ